MEILTVAVMETADTADVTMGVTAVTVETVVAVMIKHRNTLEWRKRQ